MTSTATVKVEARPQTIGQIFRGGKICLAIVEEIDLVRGQTRDRPACTRRTTPYTGVADGECGLRRNQRTRCK
ncbi:MAG: hypothetical protein ACJ8J7_06195 [Sulfurifustaceae bacterium]